MSSKPLAAVTAAAAGAAAGAFIVAAYYKWRDSAKDSSKDARAVEKAIRDRRSMFLQDFNGEAAPDDAIKRMLEAAIWAPTHGLTQPWRFTVFRRSTGAVEEFFKVQLTSSEARMKQSDVSADELAALKKFVTKQPKKAKDIAKCSHIIAISMNRQLNGAEKLMPEWEDLSAVASAVQNAHIVACQLGVAMYWTSGGTEGPLNTPEVRKMLELADGDKCLGLMCVGMANAGTWEKSQSRAKRSPLEDKAAWL